MSISESLAGEIPEYVGPSVGPSAEPPAIGIIEQLTNALTGLFSVQDAQHMVARRSSGVILRGTLLGDADEVYPVIAQRFRSLGYTPTLQRDRKSDIIVAAEGLQVARRFSTPAWVHGLLLVLTIISTTLGGAGFQGYTLDLISREVLIRHNWAYLWTIIQTGAPFALTLLLILGTHEMGHYFAARWHNVDVTLPYFIPLPITILGTLGAVIFIKSALTNRKALFDVGISGPLAGFVVAVIAFSIGIRMPQISNANIGLYNMFGPFGFRGLGMPLLLQGIGAVLRPDFHNLGLQITQQPVALAAWFGMLLTVLNLLPMGQLDGGHVTYTLFGRAAWTIASVALVALVFLGLTVFPRLLFYAFLVLLTGLRHPPPGNDITPLDPRRKLLGYATIVLFFLIATPTPFLTRG